MTDRVAIDSVVTDCERYWRAVGIKRRVAAEMRAELEQHLVEAGLSGRSPELVVGPDTAAFAMEWAAAQSTASDLPTWEDVFRRRSRRFEWTDVALLAAVVVAIGVGLATRGEGDSMETEAWQWIWVGAALFLGVAEILTAGFFLLPFAVGAVVAAGLAFAGVDPALQLTAFIIASIASLIVIQRYVKKVDETQHPVGANRFMDKEAVVLEAIDRTTGDGRVRMETEVWRATTDGGPIAAGTEVRVVEVRGARLVVAPLDES